MVWCTCFFCITCLQQIVCKCEYNMHALCINYSILLYKHQWNTKWAFAWKLDIFTCENNMLSSHVKIIYHHCYGYIINHAFHTKKLFKWMVWYFIGVYIINITLHVHGRLEIRNLRERVKSLFTMRREINIFVPPCSYVIILSSMYCSAILFGNILEYWLASN